MRSLLRQLLMQEDLQEEEAEELFNLIFTEAEPVEVGAALALLRAKGETPVELFTFARLMREHALSFPYEAPLLDIVGTGGDGADTVNLSTGGAIVAASLGAAVGKHGNRSSSGRMGSADFLESLGITIDAPPQLSMESLEECGLCFLFASSYYPMLGTLAPLRRRLGIPTIFNLLGPLLNPAPHTRLLIGVADPIALPTLAETLRLLGHQRALLVHGNGVDEITSLGIVQGVMLEGGELREMKIDPRAMGYSLCTLEELQGGKKERSKARLLDALEGQEGAIRDSLALTAGAALWVAGLVSEIEEGVQRAEKALVEGLPARHLDRWIAFWKGKE